LEIEGFRAAAGEVYPYPISIGEGGEALVGGDAVVGGGCVQNQGEGKTEGGDTAGWCKK